MRPTHINKQLQAYLYSLSTPGADNTITFGTDSERICIDTGASACISAKRSNFIKLHPITNLSITGIGAGLPIAGIGTLRWSLRDDNANEIDLYIKDALYVPKSPMGLLCPQQIAQQTGKSGDGFNALAEAGLLTIDGYTKTIPYDSASRLPITYTIDAIQAYTAGINLVSPQSHPTQLSRHQRLLMHWHQRLSHLNFGYLQALARKGLLPAALATCDPPFCKSCQYGKAHRRPVASTTKAQPIDADDLLPGDCVSVDQIESSEPGYVDTYQGKPTTARYRAASLYTDHASRFMYLKCHYSTGGIEAVEGKCRFEQLASTFGIKIKAYRGDNGIMAKKEYLRNIEENQQSISLAGINNHSQNGIAERNIRTICDRARTMILHAMERWPGVVGLDLWPFALKLAVDIHNATPGPSGLSPEEIFSKQKSRPDRLLDFHTFGCPVYVLDPRLQQGQKIPKWQPRSRQACYLGHSPRHAQTVPVVLNLKTGLCSPQYHVVFDDNFLSIPYSSRDSPPPQWSDMCQHHRVNVFEGEHRIPELFCLGPEWTDTSNSQANHPPTSEGVDPIPTTLEGAHTQPVDAAVRPSTISEDANTQPVDAAVRPSMIPEEAHTPPLDTAVRLPITSEGVYTPPVDAAVQPPTIQEGANTPPVVAAVRPSTQTNADPIVSPSNSARPGWNPNHHHHTRFKTRIQANLSITDMHQQEPKPWPTMVDQFQAMVSHLEQTQYLERTTHQITTTRVRSPPTLSRIPYIMATCSVPPIDHNLQKPCAKK
jgi:hypothetical protein